MLDAIKKSPDKVQPGVLVDPEEEHPLRELIDRVHGEIAEMNANLGEVYHLLGEIRNASKVKNSLLKKLSRGGR